MSARLSIAPSGPAAREALQVVRLTASIGAAAIAMAVAGCDTPILRGMPQIRSPNDTSSCAPDAAVESMQAAVFSDRVDLHFSSSATNEDGFVIERRPAGTIFWGELIRLGTDATLFSDFGAGPNQQYEYRAKTYRTVGTSQCESVASEALLVTTVPSAPGPVSAVGLPGLRVQLHWTDPNDFETGYRVARQSFGEGFLEVGRVGPDETTFIDEDVLPGLTYDYRIIAFNGQGVSEPAETTYGAPAAPRLRWDGPPELGVDCDLFVPGRIELDDGVTVAGATAMLSAPTGAGSVEAGEWGFSARLETVNPGVVSTSWTVEDSIGSSSILERDLELLSTPTLRALTRGGRHAPGAGASAGMQALLPGCSACQGTRGAISVGNRFGCSVRADGRVQCWGRNGASQMGRGDSRAVYLAPMPVCAGGRGEPCGAVLSAVEIAVGDGSSFYPHSCARMADGTVKCWGGNASGHVGDGTTLRRSVPTTVCRSGSGPTCAPLAGVRELALGEDFTCARTEAGTVYCWGNDDDQQLGNGALQDDQLLPVPVCDRGAGCPPLSNVTDIVAGEEFACALRDDTRVSCWGSNGYGQLGSGDLGNEEDVPVDVCITGLFDGTTCSDGGFDSTLLGFVQVDAGLTHACGVLDDSTVRCWGSNEEGQLGTGDDVDATLPRPVCASGVAGVDCVPLTGVLEVAAGDEHTCATVDTGGTEAGGRVVCWGAEEYGRLGNARFGSTSRYNPVPVCREGAGCPPLDGIIALDATYGGTCAMQGTTGRAWCWGRNLAGQLGAGHEDQVSRATQVCAAGSGETCEVAEGVAWVSPGSQHSCALMGGTGQVRCWGYGDDEAALGLAVSGFQEGPLDVCAAGVGPGCAPLDDVVTIATSADHGCALGSKGRLRCWGRNDRGQLGRGAVIPETPMRMAPGDVCRDGFEDTCVSLPDIADVSAGGLEGFAHTCAASTQGGVWCWGDNQSGQLGLGFQGGFEAHAQPVPCGRAPPAMCNPVTLRISGAVSVATGDGHSCAALEDGQVACWGANASGQLGDGGLEESTIPVTVANLAGAVAVAAGTQHTCALLITGEVRCWGDNTTGQLGTGDTGGVRVIPFPVCSEPSGAECTPMRGAVAITAGSNTTCVLLADGTLRCWGANTFRQLGFGRPLNSSVDRPQAVCAPDPANDCGDLEYACRGYLSNVVAVDLGYNSACALIADGTVRCWGQNASLQLGNGDADGISRCVPTHVCERGVGLCGAGDQASGYAVQTCDVATVVVAP